MRTSLWIYWFVGDYEAKICLPRLNECIIEIELLLLFDQNVIRETHENYTEMKENDSISSDFHVNI